MRALTGGTRLPPPAVAARAAALIFISSGSRRLHPQTVPLEQAIQEFRNEGIDYHGGWEGGQVAVDAHCAECGHQFRPSLKHVRAGTAARAATSPASGP
jgi:hypothetical protein